jgi:TRAP-type mannitol/chloroaromatic compound transport system permease small subunit
MTPLQQLDRFKGSLQFARKLLTGAFLLQSPLLIIILLRQIDLMVSFTILGNWQMSNPAFWLLSLTSSVLAIAGFTIVCRQLSLWEGDLESTEFVQRTALLGTRKIAAGVQLYFYLFFLMPLFNLVIVAWARSKASAAINDLEAMRLAYRRQPKPIPSRPLPKQSAPM